MSYQIINNNLNVGIMKTNFENLSKKGTIITVESATSDCGQTNDKDRWSYPCVRIDGKLKNIPHQVFLKIKKECTLKVVRGGYVNGELISTTTTLEIQ